MKKREGEVKEILDLAGSVIADKGFQGSGYVTPAKKPLDRELYTREREYNNQVNSIRAPIERAVAHLKTWKILFTDYRRPLNTFLDFFRAAIGLYFFELEFSIILQALQDQRQAKPPSRPLTKCGCSIKRQRAGFLMDHGRDERRTRRAPRAPSAPI
jgi:hypothetical protein